MDRTQLVQEFDQAISDLVMDLPRPERKTIADLTTAVVLEGTAVLTQASAGIAGTAQDRSKFRRAQRLLANPRFAVSRLQRRLLARVLIRTHGRLSVLLDPTTTGATRQQQGTVTLMLAIAHRGRAVPVLWNTWETDAEDQEWRVAIREMADTFTALLPEGTEVVLLTDRGLTGRPLLETARAVGWHYLLRAKAKATVKIGEQEPQELGSLVPTPGRRCYHEDVVVWVPPRVNHQAGSQPDWSRGLRTNIVTVWRTGDPEAWLLLTDLPACARRCTEYRTRTWEEALFRDLKSMGWQWQQSRVRIGERVGRLLGILVLATIWMLGVGERVRRRKQRHLLEERSRHCYSLFQLGRGWIRRCRVNNEPIPVALTLSTSLGSLHKLS